MSDSGHNPRLIEMKQRRLNALQLQQAQMGINTPPHITLEIEDLESELAQLYAQRQPATSPVAQPPIESRPVAAGPLAVAPPAKPSIFISYSHKDEAWKERLMTHLQVLALEDYFEVWDDRQIATGDDWFPEIEQAIEQASLAVLLVSVNFLTSKFIRGEEIPRMLQRRTKAGLRVFPIIVSPCPWQRVDWLSRIQVRPKNGQPLASGSDYQIDETLSGIALEIDDLLRSIG